jgi:hypothetical protein
MGASDDDDDEDRAEEEGEEDKDADSDEEDKELSWEDVLRSVQEQAAGAASDVPTSSTKAKQSSGTKRPRAEKPAKKNKKKGRRS